MDAEPFLRDLVAECNTTKRELEIARRNIELGEEHIQIIESIIAALGAKLSLDPYEVKEF